MDLDDRIYTPKVISIQHYHGNIIHSNHGDGIQPNKGFKKHRLNDNVYTILFSMVEINEPSYLTVMGKKFHQEGPKWNF